MMTRHFPDNFTWGAATSSFQIEGASQLDGKGLSDWDKFCLQENVIADGSNGNVAADHYRLFKEDVELMGKIGIKAYRFSICWPRILPEGTGKINEAGLRFYEELVDCLLSHNIEPWVTLFHWEYPQSLQDLGGWLNEQSSDWFADYVKIIVDRLSDRVTHWMTINEPQVFIEFGHQTGINAPGKKLPFSDILRISHNCLLAHGKAVKIIREHAKKEPVIGVAPVGIISVPLTETTECIEAARQATFRVDNNRIWSNSWFGDPMVLGHYPEEGLSKFGDQMVPFKASDMELINQPIDFYGTNIYTADMIGGEPPYELVKPWPGMARTTMDWPVIPESLYWGTRFLYERYKLPVVITENGMAGTDWPTVDGSVHDPARIDYTTLYLRGLQRACNEGYRCDGYFHWSLMDNFEWAFGYTRRFGLIHVDFQSQKRILKDSAYWYRKVIKSNGEILW